ncbi:phosphoenolpyruvate carboxylase-related kinase 1 [Forsythia ovata]|uniref:non-specific serine/threonine protein kinase n=1 Tax=Forsythia ovata TaxID=205694 RepID=A0ABD1WCU6_9LAMI
MDLINDDNIGGTLIQPCNCYRDSSLNETILDSNEIANFKDQYVLGDQLGWGKFGIIRACTDKSTGEVLACKSIAKERLVTQDDVGSVKLEIEIMTELSGHENVVDLKAVYEEEDYVHLLMELCAGGELFHRIEKLGRLSEHEARVTFRQLMEVVMYCHDKGIIHRDLKPENILLASKSSTSPIKLADFGLATYIKPGQALHGTVGSPFYIAPEVLAGDYNQAADVWSAGVILYILLSGMPPFWGKTKSKIFDAVRAADLHFHSDIWDHISVSAKDLISGMLHVDPSKRVTAAQVLAHSWTKDCTEETQEPYILDNPSHPLPELGGYSFSTPYIDRTQDCSFSDRSLATVNDKEEDSPVFTCRSSFSSPLISQGTPASISGGFSFGSYCESSEPKFSSPIRSMPSFTFFSPSQALEQSKESLSFKDKCSVIDGDSSIRQLFVLPNPAERIQYKLSEVEPRKEFDQTVGTSGSKTSSMQSKRNHTISLGELHQLDLIASESVIRWASCTQIPSATSLRSSLVC